jgi:hypothetical protein
LDRRDFLAAAVAAIGTGAAGLGGRSAAQAARPRFRLEAAHAQSEAPIVGINAHILTAEPIREIRALGIRHVRTTIYWPLWNRIPGFPQAFQELIDRCDDAGLRVLAVVHNWWPPDGVKPIGVDREMMNRFAEFVARRADQFPGIEAWQLWNEVDLWVQTPFGAGVGIPMIHRGRNYAEQLRLAYPLIKQASPSALVISSGTAEHPKSGFIRGMMEEAPPIDAVAVHGYEPWPAMQDRLKAAKRFTGDLPIWLTEHGHWRAVVEGNDSSRSADRLYPYALDAGEDRNLTIRGTAAAGWMSRYLHTQR